MNKNVLSYKEKILEAYKAIFFRNITQNRIAI